MNKLSYFPILITSDIESISNGIQHGHNPFALFCVILYTLDHKIRLDSIFRHKEQRNKDHNQQIDKHNTDKDNPGLLCIHHILPDPALLVTDPNRQQTRHRQPYCKQYCHDNSKAHVIGPVPINVVF